MAYRISQLVNKAQRRAKRVLSGESKIEDNTYKICKNNCNKNNKYGTNMQNIGLYNICKRKCLNEYCYECRNNNISTPSCTSDCKDQLYYKQLNLENRNQIELTKLGQDAKAAQDKGLNTTPDSIKNRLQPLNSELNKVEMSLSTENPIPLSKDTENELTERFVWGGWGRKTKKNIKKKRRVSKKRKTRRKRSFKKRKTKRRR